MGVAETGPVLSRGVVVYFPLHCPLSLSVYLSPPPLSVCVDLKISISIFPGQGSAIQQSFSARFTNQGGELRLPEVLAKKLPPQIAKLAEKSWPIVAEGGWEGCLSIGRNKIDAHHRNKISEGNMQRAGQEMDLGGHTSR